MSAVARQITQAGEKRDAQLESLRALAALGLITAHAYGQARYYRPGQLLDSFWHRLAFSGGLGNMLFFALSGYLIFWPFARHYFSDAGPVDLRRFATNRLLRIAPLYFVCVIVVLPLVDHGGSWDSWWRFLTMSENFSTRTLGRFDGPMWAVTVEVMFYALLPFLAFALGKVSGGSRLRATLMLIALGVGSWLLARYAVAGGVRRPMLQYSLPASFFYYVPGLLIALLRLQWRERTPGWLRGPLASSDLWLMLAIGLFFLQISDFSSLAVICFATFFALGACVLPLRRGRLTRGLQWRPLAALGLASYGIALWHDPIVIWCSHVSWLPHSFPAQLLIAGTISVAVAIVSFHFIEAPFLKLRRSWSPAATSASSPPQPTIEPPQPTIEPTRVATPRAHPASDYM